MDSTPQTRNQFIYWIKKPSIICLAVYISLIIILVFITPLNLTPAPKNAYSITSGDRILGNFTNLESLPSDGWESVGFPDDWRNSSNDQLNSWYKFDVEIPRQPEAESMALYLPTVRQNVAIYVNGHWIGQGGKFGDPVPRLWLYPQYFEFSGFLLDGQVTTIHVRLKTHRPASGYLSTIYLGPVEELKPFWQLRYSLKVELLKSISYLLVMIGLINLALWSLRPQDSYYGWYALAVLVWSFRGYLLLSPELPISDSVWVGLRSLSLGFGVVFIVLFNQRFFQYRNKWFDWLMFIYCIPMGLPILFMNMDWIRFYAHNIWNRVEILLGIYIMVHLLILYYRHGHKKALMLLYTGIPIFILGLRDLLVLTDRWSPQNGFLINYATPPALLLAMWFILKRFSDSLSTTEKLNQTLEQRILEKETEIRVQYQENEKMRAQQLLSEERERIMRDMHDGIGGHLVGLQALIESGKANQVGIKAYTKRALTDLRFVINSLDMSSQHLSSLLGSLRSQWQQMAHSADIKLIWKAEVTQKGKKLGPAKTLQIMRILQEAFTNSLKHSNASIITVTSGQQIGDNHSYWVEIHDNGNSSRKINYGHGIDNMRQRASAIGAELIINNSQNGYSVRLLLS